MKTNNLTPSKGSSVRVRDNAGEQYAGMRGVVTDVWSSGKLCAVLIRDLGVVDFAPRELTILA